VVHVRRGVAILRVACRRAGRTCRGRLAARWHGRTIATARFAVPAGQTRAVALRLTRAGRAALRSRRRLTVRLAARGGASSARRVTLVAGRG